MWLITVLFLLAATLPPACLCSDREQLPTVIKKIEPEYDPKMTAFILDPVEVKMTVDQTGKPFALESSVGLPDNVVRALAEWRYEPYKKNGREVAFSTKLTVPVRRPITPAVERSSRPVWRPEDPQVREAVKLGDELDADRAAKLAQDLPRAEAMGHSRTSLLIYYAKGLPDASTARQARAKLIAWLIENYPDDEILGSPAAVINASGEPLADPNAQAQEKQLWLEALKNSAGNEKIVEHAVNFLRTADAAKAAQVVIAAPNWPDSRRWLGNIYALAVLQVNARDPGTGNAVGIGGSVASAAYGKSVEAALLVSTDARATLSAMATVSRARLSLAQNRLWGPEHQAFCERLLEHTKQIYPGTQARCSGEPTEEEKKDESPIEVPQKAQAAKLRKKIEPHYPEEARARRIQGTIQFSAVIDRTGRLEQIELLSGPLVFYSETRQAISRWEWYPTVTDGHPVEVSTRIETNFSLR